MDDISENIKIVDNDLWKEFCAFPNMEIDDYIAKWVKARREAFNTTLKKYKALQWLIKQQGFIKSFGTALDDYLYGNTKKRVTSLLTEDIQSYYKLFQNQLDIV